MNSKLVYCKKQSDYTSHSFSDNQVIFIEETGEIITHGKSFGKGSGGGNVGSTKVMLINGSSYNIATTSENLPTIYAPTVLGNAGYVLKTNTKGDGLVWDTEKTYSNFKGATETLNGASGLVPQPKTDLYNYYLKGNGNWVKPSLSDFTDDVVSGNYLPLSGGTLKGKGDSVLTINRTDGWPLINFSSNANIYGYLGVNNSKELVFLLYNQSEFYKILNSNNYSSYALPLNTSTKYTLTSSNTGVVNFKSTSNIETGIRLYLGNTNGGGLWYHPNNGIYLYNGNTGRKLGIKDDGTPFYGDYTLYHTGNLNLSNYHAKGNELTIGDGTGSIVNLQIKGSTSMMSIMSFSNGTNYIESHTKDGANAPLRITGNGANLGSDLYLYFNNIYCRGNNYINLDSGNYSDYALPTTGGTITGTLSIKRDSSVIRYYDSAGTLQGWLGFNGVNNPVIFEQDGVTTRKLLHAGNYSSYALPLSGGELSNSTTGLFINRTTAGTNPHICFRSQGTNIGDIGINHDGTKPIWYNYKTKTWNDIITSESYTAADVLTKLKGVDGANSGLDADLIDGYHISVTSSPGTNATTIYFII